MTKNEGKCNQWSFVNIVVEAFEKTKKMDLGTRVVDADAK